MSIVDRVSWVYGEPVAYPDDVLVEDEVVLLRTHPHWTVLVGPVLAFLVVVGAAGYAAGWISDTSWAMWGWLVLGVVAAALTGWLTVAPFVRWGTTHLVVTTHRVLVREGVVSQEEVDVPLSRIDSVQYTRTLLDRLVGSGTLSISTAAGEPLEFEDVPRVRRVHALLSAEAEPA